MRGTWFGAIVLLAACGSTQSTSSTTVIGGGAEVREREEESRVAEESTAEAAEAVPVEAAEAVSVEAMSDDLDRADETEPDVEKRPRRDIKMMSYEEAMALPMEMGDATAEGGERQLSGEQVAWFMDDHLDEMYDQCIARELRHGGDLATVTIDMAIRGSDGMVLGTTIEPGRRRFRKCLRGYLEDIRFPTFAAPRMGARYSFRVSEG